MEIDWSEMPQRRLPVYMLLDTSGAMAGHRIASLNEGLQHFQHTLLCDPHSVECAWISVITFGDGARQTLLAPVTYFVPPWLAAAGPCDLGAALHLLNESLDRDIIQNTPERHGDYKPLIFLLMEGSATDRWQEEAGRLAERRARKRVALIGLGVGPDADRDVIKHISTVALRMNEASQEYIRAYFEWIAASVIKLLSWGTTETLLPPGCRIEQESEV